MIQMRNNERLQHMTVSNKIIGDIITLLLRGDNFDMTIKVISSLIKLPYLINGTLTTECINEIFELCLKNAHVPTIFVSIRSSN